MLYSEIIISLQSLSVLELLKINAVSGALFLAEIWFVVVIVVMLCVTLGVYCRDSGYKALPKISKGRPLPTPKINKPMPNVKKPTSKEGHFGY